MSSQPWHYFVRKYIARGSRSDLLKARAAVQEASRRALVDALVDDNAAQIATACRQLNNPLDEELLTAKMAFRYFEFIHFSEWQNAPAAQREACWQRAKMAGLEAIQLACQFGSDACEGLFAGELAESLLARRELVDAWQHAQNSFIKFRALADEDFDEYRGDLSSILCVQGLVLRDQRLPERARKKFEQALKICPPENLGSIALLLNNLGGALRVLREFDLARQAYRGSLRIYKENAQREKRIYDPFVATLCVSMGLIHVDLHEWDTAWHYFEQALNTQRALVQMRPPISRLEVVKTLINMGNTAGTYHSLKTNRNLAQRKELARQDSALRAYQEAMELVEIIQTDGELVSSLEIASLFNNLGNALFDLADFEQAEKHFSAAISLYRKGIDSQVQGDSQAHREGLCVALLNRGRVHLETGAFHAARTDLKESLAIRLQQRREINAAMCCELLAKLETACGNPQTSIDYSHEVITHLENGMQELSEIQHRDKFKGPLEDTYLRLIDHYVGQADVEAEKLEALFESSRAVELLSGLGNAAPAQNSGLKQLAKHRPETLFVWVHVTNTQMVFALLGQESTEFYTSPLDLQIKLLDIADTAKQCAAQARLMQSLCRDGFASWHWASWFTEKCHSAYQLLPEKIRHCLEAKPQTKLCLSLCGRSINLPWELLLCQPDLQSFLGLTHQIVRTYQMSAVATIWRREPSNKTAVVVGNPSRTREEDLPHAQQSSLWLNELLQRRQWVSQTLENDNATHDKLVKALSAGPGFWAYCGHSTEFELLLSGEDSLKQEALSKLPLQGHPLVHFDSCLAGHSLSFGGRFSGLPFAALNAGASAVLSSSVVVYDAYAGELFRHLYQHLFSVARPGISTALKEARLLMHRSRGSNPFTWYSTVLWGNPDLRL